MLGCSMSGGMHWAMWAGGAALMVLSVGALIGFGVYALRQWTGGGPSERELHRRFAAGDIEESEYQERLTGLRRRQPTPPVAHG